MRAQIVQGSELCTACSFTMSYVCSSSGTRSHGEDSVQQEVVAMVDFSGNIPHPHLGTFGVPFVARYPPATTDLAVRVFLARLAHGHETPHVFR